MSTRVVFAFPGGAASVPRPTRAELILSAKQWATAAKERAHEAILAGSKSGEDLTYIVGCMGHIERVLGEIESK